MKNIHIHTFVGSLLDAWKAAGHSVGVDTHLQIKELLRHLPDDTQPVQLKTLLSPILVGNKEEQDEFYQIYDRATPTKFKRSGSSSIDIIIAIVLLISIILIAVYGKSCNLKSGNAINPLDELNIIDVYLSDSIKKYCFNNISETITSVDITKGPKIVQPVISVQLNSKCISYQGLNEGTDTILLSTEYLDTESSTKDRKPDRLQKNITLVFNVIKTNKDSFNLPSNLTLKPYNHQPDISTLLPDKIPLFSIRHAYFDAQKAGILFGIALFLAQLVFLNNLVRYRNKKKEAEEQRKADTELVHLRKKPNDQPPYLWQLRIPGIDRIHFGAAVEAIIQKLHGRSEMEHRVLDTPRTIRTTIRQAGRVGFQFTQPTRPDEYLLLINVQCPNDHQAQLFNLLYREFERNDIHIERFYYDHDPRLCWNERHRQGITLRELQHKYGECRLLLIGTAEFLVSTSTGQLEPWTNIFDQWRSRSLLTTRPIAQWRHEEELLNTKFRLAPSTLRGLATLAEPDEHSEPQELHLWRRHPDAQILPLRLPARLSPKALFAALEAEFVEYPEGRRDERLLVWLAACAVSPVLHWDATLFFGQFIDDENPRDPLLSIENLLHLNRLAWFSEGIMPENARKGLLDWLQLEHPDKLQRIRTEWKCILEDNLQALRQAAKDRNEPDFEQSMAYEDLRMTLLVNELALDDLKGRILPPDQRRQIERELDDLTQVTTPDFIAMELLEQAKAIEAEIAQRVERMEDHTTDFPVWWSGWKWQLPVFMAGLLGIWGFNDKSVVACPNNSVTLNGNTYCINTPQDSLTYLEHLFCDTNYNREAAVIIVSDLSNSMHMIDSSKSIEDISAIINALSSGGQAAVFKNEKISLDSFLKYTQKFLTENNDDKILNEGLRLIREHQLDSVSFYRNVAISYWNKGVTLYNAMLVDSSCTYFNKINNWALKNDILASEDIVNLNIICDFYKSDSNSTKRVLPLKIFIEQDSFRISLGESVRLRAMTNQEGVNFKWEPSNWLDSSLISNPTATPLRSMLYTVKASNGFGESKTSKVKIDVFISRDISIPNYFTPNIDGIDDVFMIRSNNPSIERIVSFRVFAPSLLGRELVFEKLNSRPNDPLSGWDGTFENKACNPGMYTYQILIKFIDGFEKSYNGKVQLIR